MVSGGSCTPSSRATRAVSATYPSRPASVSGAGHRSAGGRSGSCPPRPRAPSAAGAGRRRAYGRPSGAVPDPLVDHAHRSTVASASRACAERGDGQEVAGALQPSPRVAPVAGVVGDAGHRQRVHRLQQQCPQPADEHRRIAVHPADRPFLGWRAGQRRGARRKAACSAGKLVPRAGLRPRNAEHQRQLSGPSGPASGLICKVSQRTSRTSPSHSFAVAEVGDRRQPPGRTRTRRISAKAAGVAPRKWCRRVAGEHPVQAAFLRRRPGISE